MTIKFSKMLIVSSAIHIISIAGLLMSGFNLSDHSKKIPHIKPNEMVFTIEIASAVLPAATPIPSEPKTPKPAPPPKYQAIQKRKKIVKKAVTRKKTAKKIIRKPKTIVKTVIRKTVKASAVTASQSISEKPSSVNMTSQSHAIGKAKSKSTQNPTASGTAKFNKNYYITLIKKRIAQFKHYPNSAKRRGIVGRVALQISVSKMGKITSLHITKPSGSRILDKAAIKSVRNAVPFQKMAQAVTFSFAIRYNFDDA